MRTMLVLGYGALGGGVVDRLAVSCPEIEFLVAGRDLRRAQERVNLTRYIAYQSGASPRVDIVGVDILNVGEMIDLLRAFKPDLIFNATTLIPWWKVDALPAQSREPLKNAGAGIWAAADIYPVARLLMAVEASGLRPTIVNGCYADLVNQVVFNRTFGPACGTGNVCNIVPGLALAAAYLLACDVRSLTVRVIAHHSVSYTLPVLGHTRNAPVAVRFYLEGADVTARLNLKRVFELVGTRFRRLKGVGGEAVAVGSATSVLAPLLLGQEARSHAPGVKGLPGGYPVKIVERRVELDLPEDIEEAAAVSINRIAAKWDGIESATTGGEVVTTAAATKIAREILGYDPNGVSLASVEERAHELIEKFNRLFTGPEQ
jgi:hypothetical protein